jgi:hypothetical protein
VAQVVEHLPIKPQFSQKEKKKERKGETLRRESSVPSKHQATEQIFPTTFLFPFPSFGYSLS